MTITSATSYREPDVVSSDPLYGVTLTQLETEFNNMIASVEKYGGFYIGRYETGDLSKTEAVVAKNNSDINNQNWYTMYNKSKTIAANENVTTTMICGCQWDAVLRWMYNSGDAEKKTHIYDSTGKGNYGTTSAIPTGSNDAYAVNNIYDMAGNTEEWTIEAYSTNCRVLRGGTYRNSGKDSVLSRYDTNPTDSGSFYGSRAALYM